MKVKGADREYSFFFRCAIYFFEKSVLYFSIAIFWVFFTFLEVFSLLKERFFR